jgi:flagellar biosynthesis/type III secretory pathway protein FliH
MGLGIELTPHFQIHTVELPKYNLSASAPPKGGILERWAWLLRRAEELDAGELRVLLPEPPFQKLIEILEMVSKTPDQGHIYDSLQRAARDRAWKMEAARREGLQVGLEEGREKGRQEGREEGEQLGIAKGRRIGQIRLMEQFLSEQPSDEHQLAGLTLAELDERVAKLQIRMHSQGNA